jgi:enoyl-CoA hydratase
VPQGVGAVGRGGRRPVVHYERWGSAALVTIDRPERHNAVDGETAQALLAAFERFCADDDAAVLVLTGAGGKAFCAGADLKAIETLDVDARGGPMGFTRLTSPKPTIAAISGHCLAGGLELALWCDLRVASPASTFGCSERRWGVPLIDGGTQRLPRVVGLGRALDLILTGRTIGTGEALAIGLLTQVADDAPAAALALAEQIASFPQDTVRSDRLAAIEGFGLPLTDGLALEARVGRDRLRTAHDGATRFSERPR